MRPSLSVELHAATRSEHTLLNRTIIARLPLCLPNATSGPALYAQGMSAFGHIYYGFEEAWDVLLKGDTLDSRQRQILTDINIQRLKRRERLQSDLGQFKIKAGKPLEVQLARVEAETLHFEDEIMQSILERPHLLLAYTWTMYLALFNGGRWIAKQLLNAGTIFWAGQERVDTVQSSLAFWFFGDDEDYDGEDIKVSFKERFNTATLSLTDTERNEIIEESKKLFGICADMIKYLDTNAQGIQTEPETLVQEDGVDNTGTSKATVFDYLSSFKHMPITAIWRSLFTTSAASSFGSPRPKVEPTEG